MKAKRTQVYDMKVNWRQVRRGITHPNTKPSELMNESHLSEFSLFLPADQISDISAIRDRLHDAQSINGQYEVFGRYEHQRDRFQTHVVFKGIIVVFKRASDAVQFRLFCNGAVAPTAIAA